MSAIESGDKEKEKSSTNRQNTTNIKDRNIWTETNKYQLYVPCDDGHTIGPILFTKQTSILDLKKTVCNIRLTKHLRGDFNSIVGVFVEKIGFSKEIEIYLNDDASIFYLINKEPLDKTKKCKRDIVLKGFNDQTQNHRRLCSEMQDFSYKLSMLAAAYSEGKVILIIIVMIIIMIIIIITIIEVLMIF